MARYFVSYNRHDQAWAEWIAWVVETAGDEVTIQAWDFGPGEDWVERMDAAVRECDATIAVLSPTYLESGFAAAEWRAAFARDPSGRGRGLIPFRVVDCEPEGLLATRIWVDLLGRDRDAARRLVLSAVRGDRGKPDSEPPFPPDGDGRPAPAFPGAPDELEGFRDWALERHGRLELVGLGAGDFLFDLDEVWVPLRTSARGFRLEPGQPHGAHDRELGGDQDLPLERAFLAARGRHLAVFGEPGAGKTTALRKLLHQTLTRGGASLGLPAATLPLFLRLRRLDAGRRAGTLAGFVQAELDAVAPGRFPAPFAERLWARGDLLLLLDGLDELADDGLRAGACRFVQAQLAGVAARGIRCVVSSRYAGYGGEVQLGGGFLGLDVRPLDDDLIARLVRSWYRAVLRARLPDPEGWDGVDADAARRADALVAELGRQTYSTRRLLQLVSSPLLLTLLCLVVLRGGQVPRRRVRFYAECLRVLLSRWSAAKGIEPLLEDADDALALLRPVAYALHDAGRRDDLTAAELSDLLARPLAQLERRLGRALPAGELLRWLRRGAGVLTQYAPDAYGLSHLGLQEYLAAVHIAGDAGRLLPKLAARFGEDWWREVTLLALGLPARGTFGPLMRQVAAEGPVAEHLDHLRECLEDADEVDAAPFAEVIGDDGADTARRAALLRLFAGRDEPEVAEAAQGLVGHPDADLAALARRVCGVPEPEAAVEAAVAAAFVEPRTELRFLHVPGGRFEMGAEDLWEACKPVHTVRVSPFWLAETPVTNAQYRVFVEATRHREPDLWRDRRFSADEQPVVAVSWEDAAAFCRWLAGECGRPVQLPSEAQRELAARGEEGRDYPWGDEEPDASRAVFGLDYGSGQPAPVGSVPAGRGPFGHLDLAGNVWEWCADGWDAKAYAARAGREVTDPVVQEGQESLRALRGGCWLHDARYLRSAHRYSNAAVARNVATGFRAAVSPASTVPAKAGR